MTGAPDPATLAFYDREAPAYADRAALEADAPELARFIAATPPGGRVLDLGAGSGWGAAAMAAAGLDALAMDASEGLLAEARRRYGVPTRLGRFADLADEAAFDGVWASFSLLHAPKAELPAHLARVLRALKPGGLFYAGLKAGDGEARDRLGRLYSYWRAAEIADLLAETGFVAVETETRDGGLSYDGTPSTGLHAFARRPA
jgi:SAM-dependent methyltransferase